MKHKVLLITIAILLSSTSWGQKKMQELDLLECKQLVGYNERFDLSGIGIHHNEVYVIADKKENKFLYKVNWNSNNNFSITPEIPINLKSNIDLEGVVFGGSFAYLCNEADNEVYKINLDNHELFKLPIKWNQLNLPKKEWLKNAGFEGIALDEKNNRLYLAKERDPRILIEIDLVTLDIVNQFDVTKACSNDFADIFFYEGYLYGLERNALCIAKIDPTSKKIIAHYSYKKSAFKKKMHLYEPVKYGMAEALMIIDNEIWIGWDNNGVEVSDFGKEKYNLKGHLPVIMKFSLPRK